MVLHEEGHLGLAGGDAALTDEAPFAVQLPGGQGGIGHPAVLLAGLEFHGIARRLIAEGAGDGVAHHFDHGLRVLGGREEFPVGLQLQHPQLAAGILAELHHPEAVLPLFALKEGVPGVLFPAFGAAGKLAPVRHHAEEGVVRLRLRHAGEGGALVPHGGEAGLQRAAVEAYREACAGPVEEQGLLVFVKKGPPVKLQLVKNLFCQHL